jgi:hypothetical protein
LLPGDAIELDTLDGKEAYRVERTWVVDPEDVSVLDPTSTPVLTLVTCYPFYFVGSAPRRFIVRALRVAEKPLPGRPSDLIGSETNAHRVLEMESVMRRAMSRVVLAAALLCATAAVSLAGTDDVVVDANQDVRSTRDRRQSADRQVAGRDERADGRR